MHLRLILTLYFLINVTLNLSLGINILKKYGELHKKVNKMFNKQQGSEFFFDINEFEYPRANETLRKMHKQLWQEYYECLKNTYSEIGSEKTIQPIALTALEGTLIMLKCEICISPIEIYTSDNVEWYFNGNASMVPNNKTNKLIEESDNFLISPDDRRLMIYNIKSEQAGQYWCKLGDTLSTFYYVSIDSDPQEVKVVHPLAAPHMPHATSEQIIPEYNLIIHTTWAKWSPCSTCNIIGKKNRYGYCTLSLRENINQRTEILEKQNFQEYKRQNEQTEETEQTTIQIEAIETTTQSKNLDESVSNKIRTALRVFRNRLPCKSVYLPKEILDIPNIKNRKTELMVKYCKVKCSKNVIFEVRDKQGNVLESANNSAGIYSMVQGMPIPSPPIIRTIIFKKYKTKATLTCPGNLNTDVPITWKMDNKVLNPSVIKDHSQGRIYINSQMHIIFKSLKFEDTNIYSCWQKNEIAGVIKLNVTGETEVQVNYSAIMIGGILIIIVFLVVFWKAFQGRKRFTIH